MHHRMNIGVNRLVVCYCSATQVTVASAIWRQHQSQITHHHIPTQDTESNWIPIQVITHDASVREAEEDEVVEVLMVEWMESNEMSCWSNGAFVALRNGKPAFANVRRCISRQRCPLRCCFHTGVLLPVLHGVADCNSSRCRLYE
jgi:hypothetical protein